ncbi:MAG: thymidylate kinase-like protein, partial [Coriobacteriia bacterium]|nr:thymidylate kinase-like protein [Coriobacteriia bacterium]
VFDRYVDDALVDRARYSYGGPQWIVRLARTLAPRPAVVIVLDAPAEVVAARKADVDVETLRRLRSRYAWLAEHTRGAVLIDATGGLEDAVELAVAAVRDQLHGRAMHRLGVRSDKRA